MSREKILASLRQNQPELVALPTIPDFKVDHSLSLVQKFKAMAEGIGSTVHLIDRLADVIPLVIAQFGAEKRVVSTVQELVTEGIPAFELHSDPHTYADVDVAIFKPLLAVAENSALWLTEEVLGIRVLPFITQHIVMVVDIASLLPDMHTAYEQVGSVDYGFGTFIAGPSKTADIEQSLVLGAHGPRSMTIYLYSSI